MHGGEDADAGLDAHLLNKVEDGGLVADVEVGGGLVEEEEGGFLGEGAGDEYALPLATGEGGYGAGGEFGGAGEFHGAADDFHVAGSLPLEEAQVRVAPHEHDFEATEAVGDGGCLGDHGHAGGLLARGHVLHVSASQQDTTTLGLEGAAGDVEEGALARAVGADEAHHLTGGDLEVDALEDLGGAVGEPDVLEAEGGGLVCDGGVQERVISLRASA